MDVLTQALILTAIGIVITALGLVLYVAKKPRPGMFLTVFGTLWVFAMLVFYIYNTLGFYAVSGLQQESAGPAVTTALGFILLILGVAIAIRLARRGGGK
jgi:uncharacterized membrane protein